MNPSDSVLASRFACWLLNFLAGLPHGCPHLGSISLTIPTRLTLSFNGRQAMLLVWCQNQPRCGIPALLGHACGLAAYTCTVCPCFGSQVIACEHYLLQSLTEQDQTTACCAACRS